MQRCPLAGFECGLMVWAKPWEAGEVARQEVAGSWSCACGSQLLLQKQCHSMGGQSLNGSIWFWVFTLNKTHISHAGGKCLHSFFVFLFLSKDFEKPSPFSFNVPSISYCSPLITPSHLLLCIHPVCTLSSPFFSPSSSSHLSDCWRE